jgi:hypothetical protein
VARFTISDRRPTQRHRADELNPGLSGSSVLTDPGSHLSGDSAEAWYSPGTPVAARFGLIRRP